MKVKFSRVAALLGICVLLFSLTPAAAAPATPTQGTWTPVTVATTDAINAVATASATDAWAVGDSSQVFHWNGTAWAPVPTGLTSALSINSVAPVPGETNHAFAVGQSEGGVSPSLVLDCTPTACTRDMTVPPVHQLDSVWVVSAGDIWVVGDQGTIIHKTGGAWQNLTGQNGVPLVQYHMIQMVSASEGWAVGGQFGATPGNGVLLHYDTAGWHDVTSTLSPAPALPLIGVWFISPTEGYAVGGNPNGGGQPLIYHYAGSWTQETPALATPLWYVWASPTAVFATGNGGQIFRRTGPNTWIPAYTLPNTTLYGVWLTPDGSTGWAVGATNGTPSSGVFIKYNSGAIPCPGCIPRIWMPFISRNF